MYKDNNSQKKDNKKSKKRFRKTILVTLFLLIAISTASALTINKYLNKINKVNLNYVNSLEEADLNSGNNLDHDSNHDFDSELDYNSHHDSKHDSNFDSDSDYNYDLNYDYNHNSHYDIASDSNHDSNYDSDDDSNSNDDSSENNAIYQKKDAISKNKDIKNIAVFGIDGTDGELSRSDCIMIFTIDNIHNKLKLSSIIRDSYVNIPSRTNKDKINHAYAFGGPSLAIETLNNNFDLDIKNFVAVNFSSFPKIIDALGGIELDISNDELKHINTYIEQENSLNNTSSKELSSTGLQNLDGTQALAYSRIRCTAGGDFARSHRQRIVIEKIFGKLQNLSVTAYPGILNDLLPLIKTNLTNTEILSTGLNVNELKNNGIVQERFPKDDDADGKMINGVYYYVFNEDVTRDKIQKFIYQQ